MARKRVLIVCQHYWPETFRINDISDYLQEQDCDIDVLCGIPNYPKGQFFPGYSLFKNRRQQHGGANIRRTFEVPRGANTSIRIFVNYLSFPVASLFHVPRLLTKKYDKIFLYQLSPVMMTIAGIIVSKLRRTENTMYVLDLWPENLFSVLPIRQPFLRKIAFAASHWHYRRADKIIALSNRMRDRLADITKLPDDKLLVLPQTCEKLYETDIHDTALAKRFKGKFVIFFAGNISPAQSFETIIAAAKQLETEGLHDIAWVIAGDGMSRKWLEDEIAAAGLQDRFSFEGFRPMEDIPKYNTIANVLVACLAKSDLLEATIPAKVMSYFAAGRPMALAMDGEVQTLVNDTIRCGHCGPAGDAEALAGNIRKLYTMDAKTREAMGRRGRNYHFKHFERNLTMQKLYRFIFD